MKRAALLSVIGVLLLGTSAQAQIYRANDTGGIIPWSCENEAMAQEIAGAYCARWDKYHRITSVHRQYGDFIAFNCLWSPHVNPYALPAVATRCVLPLLNPPATPTLWAIACAANAHAAAASAAASVFFMVPPVLVKDTKFLRVRGAKSEWFRHISVC